MPLALRLAAPLLAALPLAACGTLSPLRMAGTPTHFTSHQICSAVFVGGLEPDQYDREAVAPQTHPADRLIRYQVDRVHRSVTATFAGGLVRSRAVYLGPLGCVVDQGRLPPVPASPAARASSAPPIAGPAVVEPADPSLKAALDQAFAEPAGGPQRLTKAVVIVHDGRVIAERYAPGYAVDKPIHGWSMTKSVTNALLGVLVRQGRLDMNAPAPVQEWADRADPRHRITPDNLLRMQSGLKFGQSMGADWTQIFDPTAQMVFAHPDMAGYAATAKAGAAPGRVFRYANGDTLLLSRIVRDKAGGTPEAVEAFARRELFDKLGMEHPVLETDAAGTPIGASHMWATARDWARFGLLYLNDGMVGGERVLPEGWVDYSARLTPGSEYAGYGAGFWTNRAATGGAAYRRAAGLPADAFFARGVHGQFVVIVPSHRLVIVRLGYAYDRREEMDGIDRLAKAVIAAVG